MFGAQETASTTGASFKADKLERLADNLLRATGNVEVNGSGFQLRADVVELRRTPGSGDASVEFLAEGNVVLPAAATALWCSVFSSIRARAQESSSSLKPRSNQGSRGGTKRPN